MVHAKGLGIMRDVIAKRAFRLIDPAETNTVFLVAVS